LGPRRAAVDRNLIRRQQYLQLPRLLPPRRQRLEAGQHTYAAAALVPEGKALRPARWRDEIGPPGARVDVAVVDLKLPSDNHVRMKGTGVGEDSAESDGAIRVGADRRDHVIDRIAGD